MVDLPLLHNWLGNLRGTTRIKYKPRKRLHEKPTIVALQESLGEKSLTLPCGAGIDFFSQHLSATLTFSMRLVECFKLVRLRRQLIFVPFDQLQMKLRVELFEQRHK